MGTRWASGPLNQRAASVSRVNNPLDILACCRGVGAGSSPARPINRSEEAAINLPDANSARADGPASAAQAGASNILIIHNPTSGRRRGALREVIARLEVMGCRVTVHQTTCAGDAKTVALRTTKDHYDRIVVAGGDGTVNEVLNGLTPSSPPIALIPMGTANVLAAEI